MGLAREQRERTVVYDVNGSKDYYQVSNESNKSLGGEAERKKDNDVVEVMGKRFQFPTFKQSNQLKQLHQSSNQVQIQHYV